MYLDQFTCTLVLVSLRLYVLVNNSSAMSGGTQQFLVIIKKT